MKILRMRFTDDLEAELKKINFSISGWWGGLGIYTHGIIAMANMVEQELSVREIQE